MRIAKAILTLLVAVPVAGAAAGSNALLDQLQADHAAWRAAELDFQQRRDRGELSGAAGADYASYLEVLRGRVVADCQALVRAGAVLTAESPCVAFSVSPVQATPLDAVVPLNSAERTGILDAELETGLGEFDELLLREQQRIRAAAPRSTQHAAAADGGGGSGSGQTEREGDSGQTGAAGSGEAEGSGSQVGQGGDVSEGPPGAGAGGQAAVSRTGAQGQPPGIPDGSDDDVVARQLREAAEQETDPELQKKLWEEYRRYKQGIR